MAEQIKLEHHWHFEFWAYQSKDLEGKLLDSTLVEVIDAETETEALAKARGIVKRNFYFLKGAWQCTQCINVANAHAMEMMRLKIYAKHNQ